MRRMQALWAKLELVRRRRNLRNINWQLRKRPRRRRKLNSRLKRPRPAKVKQRISRSKCLA
jgi:hypothetical protein